MNNDDEVNGWVNAIVREIDFANIIGLVQFPYKEP